VDCNTLGLKNEKMKYCPNCRTEKSISEFYKNKGRSDGLTVYCADCHVAETHNRQKDLRAQAIEKLGGRCSCGFSDFRALHIDHVDGVRGVRLSPSVLYRDVLSDATGKYQLLCANCNEIKRHEEFQFGRSYGQDLTEKSQTIRSTRILEDDFLRIIAKGTVTL
jgi:hypothetical protein